MKNKFKSAAIILIILNIIGIMVLGLTGCNYSSYDLVDTNYHFDRAIVKMPDGEVKEMDIKKWADTEDGEQITITDTDGNRYLVHSANCVLIEDNSLEDS